MIDLINAKDLRSQFADLPRWCMGLPDDASNQEVTVYAELIVPELIHKPCARLSWCPYGVESLEMAFDDEPEPDEDRECLVFETTCPAYVFGNPFCDPSAEDPGYVGEQQEEDAEIMLGAAVRHEGV